MDPAVLREHLNRKPFEPFTVRMSDGQRVRVKRRDWAMLTPLGDTFVVFTDKKVRGEHEMKLLYVPWMIEVTARKNGGTKPRRGGSR